MPYPLSLEQRWQHVKRHDARAAPDAGDGTGTGAGSSGSASDTPPASSTPPPTSSNPPSSTHSSASSSASQTQSASNTGSKSSSAASQSKTSSAAPTSTASQPTQTTPTTQNTASATQNSATQTTSATNEIPTTMSPVSLPSLSSGESLSVGRITSGGQVWTVTNVVSGSSPTGGVHGSDTASSGFFANKGAVAATFIIVGLAGTALVLVTIMQIMKRKRRRQFEREVAMAARNTRKPPSFDEDDGAYPQMSQAATTPFASSSGKGRGNVDPGAGYGATAPPPPTHMDDAPASSDYYNAAPYNASGGYPPQPVPVYSSSSHGHDQAGPDYSQAYYDNGPVAYGQAYGHPNDGYNGGYAQQGYAQGGYDAYGQHPQQQYHAYSDAPQAASAAQAAPAAAGATYAGRNLTPADAQRANPGRKSLVDDTSVKSYYSEDEEAIAMPPRSELRIANE